MIMLYISINLPPEKQLRLIVIQHLRWEWKSLSRASTKAPLIWHNGSWATKLNVHNATALETFLSGTLRGKSIPPTLGPPVLYIIWHFPLTCVQFMVNIGFFKYCILVIHSITLSWKENMRVRKTHFPKSLDWKQGKSEEVYNRRLPFHWKGSFGSGKIIHNPYPHIMTF